MQVKNYFYNKKIHIKKKKKKEKEKSSKFPTNQKLI